MVYDARVLRELSEKFEELPRMRDGMMLRLISLNSENGVGVNYFGAPLTPQSLTL